MYIEGSAERREFETSITVPVLKPALSLASRSGTCQRGGNPLSYVRRKRDAASAIPIHHLENTYELTNALGELDMPRSSCHHQAAIMAKTEKHAGLRVFA